MTVMTIRAEEARIQWRETIEAAYVDKKDVVIERYGKPIVTVMAHTKWLAMLKRMKELELTTKGVKAYEEMIVDPTLDVSEEEYNQMLKKAGLSV
jgi:PHD/YefM family antitoxin component YafN of YafNO toxin-antitoxin module